MSHDREIEATEIVALIEDREAEDPIVVMLIEDMKWAVQYERENAPTWRELFTGKTSSSKGGTGTLQRAFLGIACFAMQQGTGINVTSYYLPTLLIESVNLDNETARLLTACNSVQYLFFTALALVFVERLGRRRMLITGAAGQAVSFILIAALLSQSEMANTEARQEVWASASIAFFFLFFSFFGFGWMGCSWLYPTEIVSLAMRAKATGLGVATNWIINFMGRHTSQIQCATKIRKLTSPSRASYPDRNRQYRMEVLHHLGYTQRAFRPDYIRFLSRNRKSPPRGYRSLLRRRQTRVCVLR